MKVEPLEPGEKVKIFRKIVRGYKEEELEFVSESSHSIKFTNGNYPVTVNKADIIAGDVGIESEESEMKITPEQLLQECKEYGTSPESKEAIAKKYGCTTGTLKFYFSKWKIASKLAETENSDNVEQNTVKADEQVNGNKENPDSFEKIESEGNTKMENVKNQDSGEKPVQEHEQSSNKKIKITKILQPTNFKGTMMEYKLYDGGFFMKRPNGTTVMPIGFDEVNTLINELQEIKKVANL